MIIAFVFPCQNLKSLSFGNILWHHQNLWEVPANVDNFFVLFATHNFTNSTLFNVCFYLTIGSLIQKNLTVVCYSIEKWFRLGSSLQSTCQSKRSRPSTYLGRWSLYWSALDFLNIKVWKIKLDVLDFCLFRTWFLLQNSNST